MQNDHTQMPVGYQLAQALTPEEMAAVSGGLVPAKSKTMTGSGGSNGGSIDFVYDF